MLFYKENNVFVNMSSNERGDIATFDFCVDYNLDLTLRGVRWRVCLGQWVTGKILMMWKIAGSSSWVCKQTDLEDFNRSNDYFSHVYTNQSHYTQSCLVDYFWRNYYHTELRCDIKLN